MCQIFPLILKRPRAWEETLVGTPPIVKLCLLQGWIEHWNLDLQAHWIIEWSVKSLNVAFCSHSAAQRLNSAQNPCAPDSHVRLFPPSHFLLWDKLSNVQEMPLTLNPSPNASPTYWAMSDIHFLKNLTFLYTCIKVAKKKKKNAWQSTMTYNLVLKGEVKGLCLRKIKETTRDPGKSLTHFCLFALTEAWPQGRCGLNYFQN